MYCIEKRVSRHYLRLKRFSCEFAEDAPTSDKVDLRSSLKSLQELLLQENYPLEISSLLYLILKDTPEPKKAFNRIVEGTYNFFTYYKRAYTGASTFTIICGGRIDR